MVVDNSEGGIGQEERGGSSGDASFGGAKNEWGERRLSVKF